MLWLTSMEHRERFMKWAIADKHGALIVEDAAESFGATYKGADWLFRYGKHPVREWK